jgi:hypothetical protein
MADSLVIFQDKNQKYGVIKVRSSIRFEKLNYFVLNFVDHFLWNYVR